MHQIKTNQANVTKLPLSWLETSLFKWIDIVSHSISPSYFPFYGSSTYNILPHHWTEHTHKHIIIITTTQNHFLHSLIFFLLIFTIINVLCCSRISTKAREMRWDNFKINVSVWIYIGFTYLNDNDNDNCLHYCIKLYNAKSCLCVCVYILPPSSILHYYYFPW